MAKKRSISLDILKGIAIIAISLYHVGGGILPYGYLGVDIFLVVSGYLLIRNLKTEIENSRFNLWGFIFKKLCRLWPLVILLTLFSLALGYSLMLPDDLENLAESVVASNVFANNVLQMITSRNYWDIKNQYKPLMHLWYIGVLMQAYVFIPLIILLFKRITKNANKSVLVSTVVLTGVSFLLYLLPCFPSYAKFYLTPFRVFEITAGGLLLYVKPRKKKAVSWFSLILLVSLLIVREEIISGSAMLLATVLLTMIFILTYSEDDVNGPILQVKKCIAVVGKRSYSIYIWHQFVVAFLCYSLLTKESVWGLFLFVILTTILSELSYRYIEIPSQKLIEKKGTFIFITSIILSVLMCIFGLKLYFCAGVVRDVPELGIQKGNAHRNMHAEYCDRPYSWDSDFLSDEKTHILVMGNSFARDWANILYEYDGTGTLEISYFYYSDEALMERTSRIDAADYVFCAIGPEYNMEIPTMIFNLVPDEKLYIIGNKSFGVSNGVVYARRWLNNYYSQIALVDQELIEENNRYLAEFKDHFVDMLGPMMVSDSAVRVFTDDNMYISQDTKHLTKAGAQYYSRILDIGELIQDQR